MLYIIFICKFFVNEIIITRMKGIKYFYNLFGSFFFNRDNFVSRRET